jgi:ubiquinol-cytochrome c reductase cytochrome b subunit
LSPEMHINRFSRYLPRLGLASLLLCIGSGIILSFQYRPLGNVFRNVEEITTLVPFGRFFRQLHYGSGQLFVLLMLLHTLEHFLKRRYRSFSGLQWTWLILSLGLCFFALFTGYVLKGDKEGLFAGNIFMNIIKTIPFVGDPVSRFFIVPGKDLLFLPYLYHILFLPVLIVFFLKDHIREWFPDRRFLFAATAGLFLFALFIPPRLDIPPNAPVPLVEGPWFFLGIQTLLKLIPPLWAGVGVPGLFAAGLLLLPFAGERLGRWIHLLLVTCFCFYALLTIRAFLFGP